MIENSIDFVLIKLDNKISNFILIWDIFEQFFWRILENYIIFDLIFDKV